jgi:hypothetical protein
MTKLKTTKEQCDALLIDIDDPDVTVYPSVVRDLCHDADRAREWEAGVEGLKERLLVAGGTANTQCWMCNLMEREACQSIRERLEQDNADFRAKLGMAICALEFVSKDHSGWTTLSRPPAYLEVANNALAAIRALKDQEKP